METNTKAIVRLGWSRLLGLPDDALDSGSGTGPVRVPSLDTVMVVRLWERSVVVGPDWLQERTAGFNPARLADQSTLLRCCDGHSARLVGQAVLAYTDGYVTTPGLGNVPAADDPEIVAALERACPPDDVTEVGLSRLSRAVVTLDDREAPLAGAGYAEWQGILGQLGVLTPPEHRRAGHGTTAAALALNDALDAGLVPQWRTRVDNVASRRLAHRLGLVEVGSQTTIALS
nr:GNAT family N-acetyltransferase [uncultured Friedmanniella sp.]